MKIKKRRKVVLYSVIGVLAIILAGCAGIPTRNEKAARRDLQMTEQVYGPEAQQMELPELSENSSLADIMQYALLNNPKVASNFYEWKAAVEEITTSRSLPDPMLTLNAEIISGVVEALTPALMTDPMANWPGPGKLGLQADAAFAEAMKKRAIFENELLATALSVKRAYYELWVVNQQIYWTSEISKVVDDVEQLARRQLEVGKVSQQDVLRAQMERDKLDTELENLQDSRTPIVQRLKSVLGVGPEQTVPDFVVKLEPSTADFTEQSLLETAFERNPQLKQMRAEVMQAISLYHLAEKANVPDFSFGVGANVKGSPVPFMPSIGITLPIWRDKVRAEIAQGKAGVGAAKARLTSEELELTVRFAETAFSWREADRNIKLYRDRLVPKAKASLDSARAGYPGGISSFLDLLEAERALLEFHMNEAAAEGRREINLAEMSLVILGRWPEGVMTVLNPQPPVNTSDKEVVRGGKKK